MQLWQTPIELVEVVGPLQTRPVPGVGIVVSGWDDDIDESVAQAFALDGTALELVPSSPDNRTMLDIDGQRFVVDETWHDTRITTTVRPLDNLDEDVATITRPRA